MMTIESVTLPTGEVYHLTASEMWVKFNAGQHVWEYLLLVDTATDGVQFRNVLEDEPEYEAVDIDVRAFKKLVNDGQLIPLRYIFDNPDKAGYFDSLE